MCFAVLALFFTRTIEITSIHPPGGSKSLNLAGACIVVVVPLSKMDAG